MRLRVSGLRVSLAKLLRGRWDQGERDFMLLNEARQCLDLALETFGGLVLAAEDAFDTAQADRDLPKIEKELTERVLLETRMEHADVLGFLGRLCLLQGDYEAAEDFLHKGLKVILSKVEADCPSKISFACEKITTDTLSRLSRQTRTLLIPPSASSRKG